MLERYGETRIREECAVWSRHVMAFCIHVSTSCSVRGVCISTRHVYVYLYSQLIVCEALPACVGEPTDDSLDMEQTIAWVQNDEVCIRLLTRKNRPNGSGIMRRGCTCNGRAGDSRLVCPMHMLWQNYLAKLPYGAKPWSHLSAGTALSLLRDELADVGVHNSSAYRTHDLRRGHAEACRFSIMLFVFCAIQFVAGYAAERFLISPDT